MRGFAVLVFHYTIFSLKVKITSIFIFIFNESNGTNCTKKKFVCSTIRATWRRTVARNMILLTFQDFYYLNLNVLLAHLTLGLYNKQHARLLHSVSRIGRFSTSDASENTVPDYLYRRFYSLSAILNYSIFNYRNLTTLICIVLL